MAITSVIFTGETQPHMLAHPIIALKQLNEWRDQNPGFKLISIETVQRALVPTEPAEEVSERMFDLFRVWYET